MRYFLLNLLMLLPGCSTNGRVIESRTNFLEISVPSRSVRFVCEGEHVDPENVLVGIYAVLDGVLYDFFFRSPQDKETCQETKANYEKLIQSSNFVRIVSIQPDTKSDNDFKKYNEQHPKGLGTYSRGVNAVFVRMDSEKGCVSYFEDDCNTPDRWGGVIPGKEAQF